MDRDESNSIWGTQAGSKRTITEGRPELRKEGERQSKQHLLPFKDETPGCEVTQRASGTQTQPVQPLAQLRAPLPVWHRVRGEHLPSHVYGRLTATPTHAKETQRQREAFNQTGDFLGSEITLVLICGYGCKVKFTEHEIWIRNEYFSM